MHKLVIAVFIFFTVPAFGQRESLSTVQTIGDAEKYISRHPALKGKIIQLDAIKDSVAMERYNDRKAGDVVNSGKYLFKILADTTVVVKKSFADRPVRQLTLLRIKPVP
jgi:hypothetical protein